jgi:hypothetical protein
VRRPDRLTTSLRAFNPGHGGLDELHRGVQIDKMVNAEPGPSHQFVILPGGSLAGLPPTPGRALEHHGPMFAVVLDSPVCRWARPNEATVAKLVELDGKLCAP